MATMIDVMKFFEFESAAAFKAEWSELSDESKAELKAALDS